MCGEYRTIMYPPRSPKPRRTARTRTDQPGERPSRTGRAFRVAGGSERMRDAFSGVTPCDGIASDVALKLQERSYPAGSDQLEWSVVGPRAGRAPAPPPLRYIRRRFTPAAVILLHAVRYRRGTAARRKAQAPNGTYATPGPCGTPTSSAAHAWIALSCCRECKCTEYKPRTGRRSPRPWGIWGLAQVALTLGTCHPSPCRHSPHRV